MGKFYAVALGVLGHVHQVTKEMSFRLKKVQQLMHFLTDFQTRTLQEETKQPGLIFSWSDSCLKTKNKTVTLLRKLRKKLRSGLRDTWLSIVA